MTDMVAMAKLRMSVGDFLRWESDDDLRYELVDGEPRAMAPASTIHGFLLIELGGLIRNDLRERRGDCRVIGTPGVVPPLMSAHNCRIPDLAVTCSPLSPGQSTLPDPVLLIEILSASNQPDTWSHVWAYTSIASVQEILILHTDRIGAELLRRSAEGSWPAQTEDARDGMLVLTSIGFGVPLGDLYAGTGLTA